MVAGFYPSGKDLPLGSSHLGWKQKKCLKESSSSLASWNHKPVDAWNLCLISWHPCHPYLVRVYINHHPSDTAGSSPPTVCRTAARSTPSTCDWKLQSTNIGGLKSSDWRLWRRITTETWQVTTKGIPNCPSRQDFSTDSELNNDHPQVGWKTLAETIHQSLCAYVSI